MNGFQERRTREAYAGCLTKLLCLLLRYQASPEGVPLLYPLSVEQTQALDNLRLALDNARLVTQEAVIEGDSVTQRIRDAIQTLFLSLIRVRIDTDTGVDHPIIIFLTLVCIDSHQGTWNNNGRWAANHIARLKWLFRLAIFEEIHFRSNAHRSYLLDALKQQWQWIDPEQPTPFEWMSNLSSRIATQYLNTINMPNCHVEGETFVVFGKRFSFVNIRSFVRNLLDMVDSMFHLLCSRLGVLDFHGIDIPMDKLKDSLGCNTLNYCVYDAPENEHLFSQYDKHYLFRALLRSGNFFIKHEGHLYPNTAQLADLNGILGAIFVLLWVANHIRGGGTARVTEGAAMLRRNTSTRHRSAYWAFERQILVSSYHKGSSKGEDVFVPRSLDIPLSRLAFILFRWGKWLQYDIEYFLFLVRYPRPYR